MRDPFARQSLDGKVLVVTGSTQGLGAEIARRAARRGAAGIVVCGRHRARGEAVLEELEGLGSEAEFVEADLSESEPPVAVVRACEERFGRLDGLVNAPGSAAAARSTTPASSCGTACSRSTCGRRFS